MKFSILVPTMGTRETEIARFLESLDKQTYKDFEIVFVSQINHNIVNKQISLYENLKVKHIELETAGLSFARNQGLPYCSGDWVILSDDDAWYPDNGLQRLSEVCNDKYQIALSQIYDPIKKEYYKSYGKKGCEIKNIFKLMSKSSIEIAFNREMLYQKFDERFGLGAKYCCGEEVDFLLRAYKTCKIFYFPTISVFHQKKEGGVNDYQQYAKGALYAKHFNRIIAWLITVRDTIKKRKVDIKKFWKGYKDFLENDKK